MWFMKETLPENGVAAVVAGETASAIESAQPEPTVSAVAANPQAELQSNAITETVSRNFVDIDLKNRERMIFYQCPPLIYPPKRVRCVF